MNKVEAQYRILRNLAVIGHQVDLLNRHGQNISMYSEAAIADSLSVVAGQPLTNLNSSQNNYPGLDLLSADGTLGIQATAKVTKAKMNQTVAALVKQFTQSSGVLPNLRQVEVIGFTCVTNKDVTTWREVTTNAQSVTVRGIALVKRLELANRSDIQLVKLDRMLQGLASTSLFNLRADEVELQTIIAYLDRPAIRDDRHIEANWSDMQDAMRSIRRLLGQGANDMGQQITRPYSTFQPAVAGLLQGIYADTAAISRFLRGELQVPGSISTGDKMLLDGYRLRIQEKVTDLAAAARLPPPAW